MDNLNTSQSSVKCYLESSHAHRSISEVEKEYHFKNPIIPNPGNSLLIQLVDFQCPHSWYTVNESNNTISIFDLSNSASPTTHVFIIPIKNYNILQLVNQINLLLAPINMSCSYDQQTNRVTFTKSSINDFFFTSNSTCLDLLGIGVDNRTSTNTLSTPTLIGSKGVDLIPEKNIYVQIDFNLPNMDSFGTDTHILGKIPVNEAPLGIISYRNNSGVKMMITDKHIELITIRLTDHNNKPLAGGSLNGADFSLCIAFYFIEDRKHHDLMNRPETSDEVQSRLDKKLLSEK